MVADITSSNSLEILPPIQSTVSQVNLPSTMKILIYPTEYCFLDIEIFLMTDSEYVSPWRLCGCRLGYIVAVCMFKVYWS